MRVVDVDELAQIALGFRKRPRVVPVAALEQQLRLDRSALGAKVQVIGEHEQIVVFARIAFVEYVANIDVDAADDRALGLQHRIARHPGGARLLDLSVLRVGELGRERRLGQSGNQDAVRDATQKRPNAAADRRDHAY